MSYLYFSYYKILKRTKKYKRAIMVTQNSALLIN